MSDYIELKNIAEKLSPMTQKILKYMSNKDTATLDELYTISGYNKTKLFETLKWLDIIGLIERQKDEKNESKKLYLNTELGDNIIKYF